MNNVVPASPVAEAIQRVQREIQTLRNTAHILTPMARTQIDRCAVGKIPILRVTSIDPDPKHGEVYEIKQLPGRFALTKVGLQRLDSLAGITGWRSSVEKISPTHVKAVAVAAIEDIDGTLRECPPQTFELDLADGTPQAEKMIKIDNGQPNLKELKQARLNIVPLAESKAQNRVRRVLLNLQATFTQLELQKPFVIMKLVDAPLDASDPLIRKLLIMKQLKISSEMYESAAHDLAEVQRVGLTMPESIPGPPIDIQAKEVPDTSVVDVEAELHAKLVVEVEDMYKRKVKGGRDPKKVSLHTLTNEELNQISIVLSKQKDLA